MFNSAALNVVIGMVMIYLLYSLLVTILGEMIGSWLGIRARVLRRAIERMLNDGYEKERGRTGKEKCSARLREFFLREHRGFSQSFAGRFYEYAAIKYLSEKPKTFFSPPNTSYITKETFAQALIHLFREKGVGTSDIKKISYCLNGNGLQIQPQTLSFLNHLCDDAKGDLETFSKSLQNWFEETMQRTTGWYKKKNRMILFGVGFSLAAIFNVDSIEIARHLSKDNDARNQLVALGIALARDTVNYRDFVHENGDTVRARAVLDSGFTRVTKDIAEASHILGLGWDFGRKTESYSFSKKDDLDSAGRAFFAVDSAKRRMCEIIEKDVSQRSKLIDAYNADILFWDSVRAEFQDRHYPAERQPQDTLLLADRCMRLDSIHVHYQTTRRAVSLAKLEVYHDSSGKETEAANAFLPLHFLSIQSIRYQEDSVAIVGTVHRCVLAQIWLVTCESMSWKGSFWGLLITALMLSFGAPFWFDLLQKFVLLRSEGIKPEESKPEPDAKAG